ncbi:MAG: molybdopterin-guanine dinucleotide biosynthesis protein B [Myxococcales bacterium FL481]|nr:MAG: molybdopterin-guanine dinucleotide biosynthesis protein B [Myxococcales bacterium FL481]
MPPQPTPRPIRAPRPRAAVGGAARREARSTRPSTVSPLRRLHRPSSRRTCVAERLSRRLVRRTRRGSRRCGDSTGRSLGGIVPARMRRISLEQALELLRQHTAPLGREPVALDDALGRTLAHDVVAPWDLPTHTHAAMDGFAVRANDVAPASADHPVELALSGASHAGGPVPAALSPGQTIAVTTGGPIPPGADAVVRMEDTQTMNAAVHVTVSVEPGRNIRVAGEDTRAGDRVLSRGAVLDGIAIGVLASFGHTLVEVYRRPQVVVTSCGDELVGVERAHENAVVDSNSPMLVAMARENGADALSLGIAPDQAQALRELFDRATAQADVVLTSAGASVGERDLTRAALQALGAEFVFAGVAIRPGKPIAYARRGATHVFCLPGNPGAAAMTFELLVGPALRRLGGARDVALPWAGAGLTAPVTKRAGLQHAIWTNAHLGGNGLTVEPLRRQGSASLNAAVNANAIALLPQAANALLAGQHVSLVRRRPPIVRTRPPVLGVVGLSNTGKTTLMVKLIERLGRRLRIAAVKHGHRFDVDRPGKDTFRFSAAGASAVAFASPGQRGLLVRTDRAPQLDEVLASLPDDIEFVLVEGYKLASIPKLEVIGPNGRSLAAEGVIGGVVGFVSRAGTVAVEQPCFDADDLDGIEDWLTAEFVPSRDGAPPPRDAEKQDR